MPPTIWFSPPFVDAHYHMDTALSIGHPRHDESGTLLEGIRLWGEAKPHLGQEIIAERALRYCDWVVGRGLLAIRSHVDIGDPRLLAVDTLIEVRRQVAPYLDLQAPRGLPAGRLSERNPAARRLLEAALDRGVDVVGGIPHFERTMAEGAESVRRLCEPGHPARGRRSICIATRATIRCRATSNRWRPRRCDAGCRAG